MYFTSPPEDAELGGQKYVMKIDPETLDLIILEADGFLDDLIDCLGAGKVMRGHTNDCLLILYPLLGCASRVSARLKKEVDQRHDIFQTFRPLNADDPEDGRIWMGSSEEGDAACCLVYK